ncbi:hypothetical protein BUALT_Bualt04G0111300 [Buddleja alternifolia]|uniref:Uncharacterized protein n=1 Tax=Buddleja alternifolia TaxID=168488 RepID=A0AAV6XUG6_9LAMI|nr:hypothetical protein BUALT_Bualt04G0111300 [Buddleja alternifolia]
MAAKASYENNPYIESIGHEIQNLLRQVNQTDSDADRILGNVRSSLPHIASMVGGGWTHTGDAQQRWAHTQPYPVYLPSPVYRPTVEPQSQILHPSPAPQSQGFYYDGDGASYGRPQSFNYGGEGTSYERPQGLNYGGEGTSYGQGFNYEGEGTSYRRSYSSDPLIPLEMFFGATESTPPQNQRNISPVPINWDMNSPAPHEQEYVTQQDQPTPRNDRRRRSERVVNPTICLTEL